MTLDEAADEIFHGAGFDDAMDMINRNTVINRIDSSSDDDYSDVKQNDDNDGHSDDDIRQGLLDVEILDQHIDKAGITGGADATRAIENMAGGGKNDTNEFPDDEEPSGSNENGMNEFANAMLGGSVKKPRINMTGSVRGHSGVTSEIRIKGNRVTERERNGSNYLTEDGYVNVQSMLGGGSSDSDSDTGPIDLGFEDDGYPHRGDIDQNDTPATQGPATEKTEETDQNKDGIMEEAYDSTNMGSENEDYSGSDEETYNDVHQDMSSEIDHVLSQLRNKTARTLTGGTVNIRKKVVLTDMYPYIIRT